MASQGPNNGGAFASNGGNGGIVIWAGPSDAQTSNDVRATALLQAEATSLTEWLQAQTFGFTIPSSATILGVLVEIEKSLSGAGVSIDSEDVRLLKAGGVGGANYGVTSGWGLTDAYTSYGGAADLWGRSWLPSDINAANFGMVIAATFSTGTQARIAQVDHIRITVYYEEGGMMFAMTQVI